MPDDYPAYPKHNLMLNYIRSYARHFGVYEKAKFNTEVIKLEPAGETWSLSLSTGEKRQYPLVCVCNGLQRIPHYPRSYGENFSGKIMHSAEYKKPEQIKGKRLLIVGAGNSGCDIAVDAVHHSEVVYHSTRRGYYYQPKFIHGKPTSDWMMDLVGKFKSRQEGTTYIKQVFKLAGYDGTDYGLRAPDYPLDAAHPIMNSQILYHIGHGDIHPKNEIKCLQDREVIFEDGSRAEIDVLLYATGFDRDFPFLEDGIIEQKEGIPDLFLHAFPRNINNIIFLGFLNTATGLGTLAKTSGRLLADYTQAYQAKTRGYFRFLEAKKNDHPDLGQNHFIKSRRHFWEVDLWMLLKNVNQYRTMINER